MFPAPQDLSSVLQFDVGIFITLLLLARLLKRETLLGRIVLGTTSGLIIATYAAWRWMETLPPFEWSPAVFWTYVFFAFEICAIFYTLLSIVILLRWRDRSREADAGEALLEAQEVWPSVDVFICTYNETLEVLEKSIIPSLNIDYPDFTVWVLDDTRRDWLRDYCDRVGARYITRRDNKGAKAGNLNNGLRHTAYQTNAPLVLVLDADFAPAPNILRRTIGLFADPATAIVQTPQFFYNSDPIQHNLRISKAWVDDQRIFFDIFQPAKDAWGCAFCVGTSFVVRRDRLHEIGGFPDGAICEDIDLTYQLMRRGYETHWLNEPLSIGLAAEGLPEYISQRARWCLGTVQVALLKSGPFFGKGYTFVQRLHYFHGMLNWLCKPFILLMLIAPSFYWLFDMPAFYANYLSFLRYGLPALLALWVYGGWISNGKTLPLFMEVTHTLPSPAISATLVSAMLRPFGRPFKVTDKGGDRSLSQLRWKMAATFGSISLLSAGAIIWAMISPYAESELSAADMFNLIWAGVALVLTFISFLVCFERPRHEERFVMDETADVTFTDAETVQVWLTGLSLGTASLVITGDRTASLGEILFLRIDGVPGFHGVVSDCDGSEVEVAFAPNEGHRNALLVRLFSEPREQVATQGDLVLAFHGLFKRAFQAA